MTINKIVIHCAASKNGVALATARQIAKWLASQIKHAKPVMSDYDVDADDKKLAKLLDGSGYSGVFRGKQVMKLLPLFPGDRMDVRFDFRQ